MGLRTHLVPVIALLLCVEAEAAPKLLIRCPTLSAEQEDELSARARLLLLGAPPPTPDELAVTCTPPAAITASYGAESRRAPLRVPVTSVDAVLAAIEQLLTRAVGPQHKPAVKQQTPPTRKDADVAQRTQRADSGRSTTASNSIEQKPQTPAESSRRSAGQHTAKGGVALSGNAEAWPAPASFGVGPRLDFALGLGSWSITSFESLRVGSARSLRLLAFDASLGLLWGAPFAKERWGASLVVGREWLSAVSSPAPTGDRTTSTTIINVGLRLAQPLGPTAIWLGVDGRVRLRKPSLEPPIDAELARWSALLSFGVALPAE